MRNNIIYFRTQLELWHESDNYRQLPWKEEQDPYKVWLSEIILQQTRVEQGLKYYHAFVQRFPKLEDLANAEEDEVLRLWQGLGYYSRARNLHYTAKDLVNNYNGIFPSNYQGLLKLKGVGKYTAAAIASFVFKEKAAVVDGNVIRVIARYFMIDTPFDTSEGRRQIEEKATQLILDAQPDKHNQAIMDFGSVVCKPKKPLCNSCPMAGHCQALKNNLVNVLPQRKNRTKSISRYFIAFHIEVDGAIAIHQRSGKDIWQNLYQLPWKEVEKFDSKIEKQVDRVMMEFFDEQDFNFEEISEVYTQQLSHQKIHTVFVKIKAPEPYENKENYIYTRNLTKFAFPKIFILYLQAKSLILE